MKGIFCKHWCVLSQLSIWVFACAITGCTLKSQHHSAPPEQISEVYHLIDSAKKMVVLAKYDSAMIYLSAADDRVAAMTQVPDTILGEWHHAHALLDFEQGRMGSALNYYKQAVSVYESDRKFSAEHVVHVYNNLGRWYIRHQELDSAECYLKKSINAHRQLPPSEIDTMNFSRVLNNLGAVFHFRSMPDSAISYYDQARTLIVMQKGEDHPEVARAYFNIGLARESKGYYADALMLFRKALDIYLRHLGNYHPQVAEAYGALGFAHFAKNEFDRAIYYFQKDAEIITHLHGGEHPDLVFSWKNMGEVYAAKGDTSQAMYFLEKALQANLRYFGARNVNTAEIYLAMAELFPGEERSLTYAYASLRADSLVQESPTFNKASCYKIIAQTLAAMHETDNAARAADQHLMLLGQLSGDRQLPGAAVAYYTKAKVEQQRDNWYLAFLYTDKGLAISRNPDRSIAVAGADPQAIVYETEYLSGILQKAALFEAYYRRTKDPVYLSKAMEAADAGVSLIRKMQVESTSDEASRYTDAQHRQIFMAGLKAAVAMYEYQPVPRHFDKVLYYTELLKNRSLAEAIRSLDNYRIANIPEATLRREYQLKKDILFLRNLLDNEPQDADLSINYRAKLEELYKAQEKFFANLRRFHPEYYRLKYETQPIGRKHLQKNILRDGQMMVLHQQMDSLLLVLNISQQEIGLCTVPVSEIKPGSSDALLPGAALAVGIRELIWINEPALSLPPAESWMLNDQRLLERFGCVYNSSASLYARRREADRLLSRSVLAFAPLHFKAHQLPDLPHSIEELQRIHRYLSVVPIVDSLATVDRFRKELSKYSVVHLATHAQMDRENPLSSALYFSKQDSADSGILYAHEIFGLPLRAQLVTLSACYTSDSSGVLEGVSGIAAAFAYNGCSNILMSLWEMEDKASMEVVSGFYRFLSEGYSKTEALRLSKLEYLKSSDRYSSEPFYWAGIVLFGDHIPFDLGESKWAVKWWIPALIALALALLYSRRWWLGLRV